MLYGDIYRQRLILVNAYAAADTIDYLEMKFTFRTADWDGLEKWVHFAKDDTVYDIRLTEDCVRREDHLNLSAGTWKVYLHGNRFADGEVTERITTNAVNLTVERTGSLNGEPFPEIPASVTEQILARLENVEQNGGSGGSSGGGTSGGVSPTAKVERTPDGAVITITDASGTTTAEVYDGAQGSPGTSPSVSVTDITGGHRVKITDAAGQKSFDVMDGAAGSPGVSPTARVEQTDFGAVVTVTDASGTTTAEIYNGEDGSGGTGGGSADAVLYTAQELTDEQAAQARDNIGAANADFFVRTANIFDKSNPDVVMAGYFYRNSSGAYVENSNYTALTIPTKPNTTYICTGTSYTVSFLTEEKKYWNNDHSSADGAANHVFTTPANTAYTVLSVKHGKYPLDKYMVVEGDELPSAYVPYGDALSENVYVNTGENVFYVGAIRRFSRFYDCINAIKDIEGEKTVYVDSGVYDLYSEIGGDEFAATITSTAWRDWSVILPNDIRIIGIGNVVFNFILPDSVSDKAYSVLSPINVYGSVYMENITINAKNCRYTLHDDGASEDMPYTRHIYKNMTFNKLSGNGYGAACGNGIGKGVTFEFENCIINSEKTLGMSFHNYTNKADGAIIISNCYLNGTNTALRLGSMSSYGEENAIAVNVFNTKFGNKIEICMEDTATGKTNPFKTTFVNCGELTFDTSEYTDMQFPPVVV